MRNVNPEWYYGWDQEPDWDSVQDALVDLVEALDEPTETITADDLDEALCNFEGRPVDDCRCSF